MSKNLERKLWCLQFTQKLNGENSQIFVRASKNMLNPKNKNTSLHISTKGGFMSESTGRFSNCPKNVPKTILNYYIITAMIKILISNTILKFKNCCYSFKVQLKNANDTAYVECVKCFKHIGLFLFLEPVNRLRLYMQKKITIQIFSIPGQFSALILGNLKIHFFFLTSSHL